MKHDIENIRARVKHLTGENVSIMAVATVIRLLEESAEADNIPVLTSELSLEPMEPPAVEQWHRPQAKKPAPFTCDGSSHLKIGGKR